MPTTPDQCRQTPPCTTCNKHMHGLFLELEKPPLSSLWEEPCQSCIQNFVQGAKQLLRSFRGRTKLPFHTRNLYLKEAMVWQGGEFPLSPHTPLPPNGSLPVHANCTTRVFDKQVHNELVRLDEQELSNKYKIGVLYCKKGQTTEEEMYNNGESKCTCTCK